MTCSTWRGTCSWPGFLLGLLVWLLISPGILAQPARLPAKPSAVPQQVPARQEPPPVVEKPQAAPVPPRAPKESHERWIWLTGGILLAIVVAVLVRIVITEPKPLPPSIQDDEAKIRQRRHKRGTGATPASREEQQLSKALDPEFLKAPLRQGAVEEPLVPEHWVRFYAPLSLEPLVPHDALAINSLPHLGLLIAMPHPEAKEATFLFNRLAAHFNTQHSEAFFAFNLPSATEALTVRNVQAGRLEKHGATWQVVQKATVLLS